MSVKRPEPFEATPSVEIRVILQDPQPLTGKPDKEVVIKGRKGDSVLGACLDAGIELEHSCGGVCACSTCHVYINAGAEDLSEREDAEMDRVEEAPALKRSSRLACQCRILGNGPLTIEVPAWNRNAVKEATHE